MTKSAIKTRSKIKNTTKEKFPPGAKKPPPSQQASTLPSTASQPADTAPQPIDPEFPIVGVGASAGGLEAFSNLLQHLPANPGMAFVLVQHLDPTHASMLTEILSRVSSMPVRQVSDGMLIEPNCVFVIPPNSTMTLVNGNFQLIPRTLIRGLHMPIDYFFRSLARHQGPRAIGVILSGNASDGALGLEAIKGEGGITFVQDDRTAKFSGMPRSAIATGSVDFILPVDGIAQELVRIGKHPFIAEGQPARPELASESADGALRGVLRLLKKVSGVDFTLYKPNTIRRRIMRRMALHRIHQIEDYLKFLKDNSNEMEDLYRDMLIKVTGFFRDPEAFEALKRVVFPALLKTHTPGRSIRIWVPGCATGEEVYSIAMCLLELLGDRVARFPVQFFATDIDEGALAKARAGHYIENIVQDVSPERLRRFFLKNNGTYEITKSIREMCVFAKQNVLTDPPFSNLDLISCRNLLIYLGPASHKTVISLFHYALKPPGFLLLGNSENIGTFPELFKLIDKKNKIYSKKAVPGRLHVYFPSRGGTIPEIGMAANAKGGEPIFREIDVQREADRALLHAYSPPGVVIDEQTQVLQFRGDTSHYLIPPPGRATFDLLRMAREGLLVELRAAVQEARKTKVPAFREGVRVKFDGEIRQIDLRVIPIKPPGAEAIFYAVTFEAAPSKAVKPISRQAPAPRKNKRSERSEAAALRDELHVIRQHLQSIIEEYEAANEELKSANEEILSSNEELQSTNEEVETAKEELQSSNEELTTMNEEIQNRNRELSQLNNDLFNLLGSARLAILILERDLRIRICTPEAEKLLKLLPTDVGRPITDLHLPIDVPDLEDSIVEVVDSMKVKQLEVKDREGRPYSLWIRPYRTTDNRIDGAVLVFSDAGGPKGGEEMNGAPK